MAMTDRAVVAGLPTQSTANQLAKALCEQTGPVTADVQSAAHELEAAILKTQNNLHELVAPRTRDIERQVVNAEELSERVAVSSTNLDEVELEFDANQPKNIPEISHFLSVIATRQSAREGTILADLTTKALQSLRASYERLRQAEDAVWSGRGADPTTLDCLGGVAEAAEQYSGGEAAEKLHSRSELLNSLVKEQLSTAWTTAFAIKNHPEGPVISVASGITLTPPNASRASSTSERPLATGQTYTIGELSEALDRLGILEQLLSKLQAQVLRDLVIPALSPQMLVAEGYQPGNKTLHFRARVDASLTDRVAAIRDLIRFMEDTFSSPGTTAAVSAFLSSLSDALYRQVLHEMIIPAMPRELSKLPSWLRDIEQCADWEDSGPGDSRKRVLQTFLAGEAGNNWLACHRAAGLLETRSLVYEGWKEWDYRLEETDTEASSLPRGGGDGNEEGWGFDEELDVGSPPPAQAHSDGGGDGWDFDDLQPATAQPERPAPAPLAKPAREAKRLGKKLHPKHTSAAASQEALAESADAQRCPPSPPTVDTVQRAGSTPRTSLPPSPEETWMSNSSIRVSVATDTALKLLSSRLLELQTLESLTISAELRNGLRKGLQSQLTDVLDFLRATLPVAHQSALRAAPTNSVQLGNDFRFMSSKMLECEPGVTWPKRAEAAAGYVSAATMTYQAFQVQEQLRIRDIFRGTNFFVDLGEDNVYQQAEAAAAELVQCVSHVASQLKPLVNDQGYHEMLGAFVETVSVLVINSVLAMEDITEVESQRIESLIQKVEVLQKLFRNDTLHMSSVATYAPHWLKMCYTTEILRANLAEISHLYENGSLMDFTPAELSKLIRALFADSQKRAAVLDMVNR